MARLCCLPSLLPVIFALFLQTCESALNRVISQSYRATGVFLLIEGGTYYTLNFTAARDACLSLNVTMATEVQISQAIQHGLETCKYGWIAEQTAVVPRISPEQTCGQGKTGVVTWKAPADKKFGVFCFDASALTDLETTASPQSPTSPTPLTTQTTHLVTSTTKSMSSTKKSITGKSRPTLQPTPSTSASDVLVMTSRSARISSSATPSFKTFSTHIPVSLPPLTTTNPPAVTLTFSASTHAFNFPASSEWPLPQTENSAKPSLGALHVTVIVLGIILLLLTAASAMWYFQVNVFRCLSHWQQMDNIETEMWNFTNNAMNHLGLQGDDDDDDEEESHRMYSSDITLCVKSDIKANSSE
ncbi:lymphatic vessel endothelial hyaluronic receptor 1b isoform X1 [Oreochromis aureus]|uniref:Link domain-containing protein n=2 Tax=Oreochromis aureus TaxID=47969 RepID=A0A668U6W3_OREAU|nr:lymphatic vessel endothelial hyaluronic receptor 1b isoform X1 [Oreochromis aureus]